MIGTWNTLTLLGTYFCFCSSLKWLIAPSISSMMSLSLSTTAHNRTQKWQLSYTLHSYYIYIHLLTQFLWQFDWNVDPFMILTDTEIWAKRILPWIQFEMNRELIVWVYDTFLVWHHNKTDITQSKTHTKSKQQKQRATPHKIHNNNNKNKNTNRQNTTTTQEEQLLRWLTINKSH